MKKKKGKVILVGAGPGEPGLLTLKGAEMLRKAEAVVYDWLASPELLHLAPQAEKVFVGKKGGTHYKKQKEINKILQRFARQGKFVVRLKGGDPFIFGRGGEEASFLARHRIPFEVVPGVSAGTGVPAYAGIPLTDRRFASQVTFVTGHEDPTKKEPDVDWKALASLQGTLVFFMGVKNLPRMVHALLKAGKPASTPVGVIEWGTLPTQKIVIGTLKDILRKTKKARIESPALTVIGEVVRLRRKLAWFSAKRRGGSANLFGGEKKPLHGKTVVVTRARTQASELVRKLKEAGAWVLELPTIQILPPSNPGKLDREIREIEKYDWIVFTSANGVESFFERVDRLGKDARIFSGRRIAAIGEATAEALRQKGLRADLIPPEFTSQSLFESLKKTGEISGKKFLLVRADIAPPDLRKNLEKEEADVVEVEGYRTKPVSEGKKGWFAELRQGKIDYVTFTSSSTVRNFFKRIPAPLRKRIRTRFISIGPVTSRTLREYGFRPAREARVHTIQGLIDILVNGGRSQ